MASVNTTTEHDPAAELTSCAASSAGWVGILTVPTREWAAGLPSEVLRLELQRCAGRLRSGTDPDGARLAARRALLVLACKDPELLQTVPDELHPLVPEVSRPLAA
jgi:hypothetical protein